MTTDDFIREWQSESQRVMLRTSGSTGTPKTIWVEKSRMRASARMTCDFLGLRAGQNALLCLSTDYIAGKMMVVRAMERGLHLISVPPSNNPLDAPQLSSLNVQISLTAMVPSQVYCSIDHPMLRRIENVIIGGGAIPPELEQTLRLFPNAIWSSYGMTETLSHIALRRVSGSSANDCYTPLPGVGISLSGEGCLCIDAPHLCAERLLTNDIAEINRDGSFRIIGRRDNVIQSGGLKLHIEQMEERLRPFMPDSAGHPTFCVTSRPSAKFGEEAVLLTAIPVPQIGALLHDLYIKDVIPVEAIPLTPTGKIDRAAAKRLAKNG